MNKMAQIVTKTADTLIERVCDRLKDDKSKVFVYTVYRMTRISAILIIALTLGIEAISFMSSLI